MYFLPDHLLPVSQLKAGIILCKRNSRLTKSFYKKPELEVHVVVSCCPCFYLSLRPELIFLQLYNSYYRLMIWTQIFPYHEIKYFMLLTWVIIKVSSHLVELAMSLLIRVLTLDLNSSKLPLTESWTLSMSFFT